MEEETKELKKLMRRWLYIGTGALYLSVITTILFYYERNWVQLLLISIQLIIIVTAIRYYTMLKKKE